MKKKRVISKTPRGSAHNRKVQFSISMREKISSDWVAIRKGISQKTKKKKR